MSSPISLGPGQLAPGPGEPFALDGASWRSVRRYALTAVSMPTNADQLRSLIGLPPGGDIGPVADALPVLTAVQAHGAQWSGLIWPKIAGLGSDIRLYASQQEAALIQLRDTTEASDALRQLRRDAVRRVLQASIANAMDAAAKARSVFGAVGAFVPLLQNDAQHIATLRENLGGRLASTDATLKATRQQTQVIAAILQQRQAEYEHDKIVAATSVTYAWIWPFGTIAAAVVAGKFGSDAVDVSGKIDAVHQQLAGMDAELRRDTLTLTMLDNLTQTLGGLATAVDAALPVLQRIEGAWQALADRLTAAQSSIDPGADPSDILGQLGIQAAIDQWHALGAIAAAFLQHAFDTNVDAAFPLPAMSAAAMSSIRGVATMVYADLAAAA